MEKRKDYFSAIVMGTIWTIFCCGLTYGVWWLIRLANEGNMILASVLAVLAMCLGLYKGKEFFKVEMVAVKKNDPQTDWFGFLDNLQLLCIAMVMVNSVNVFNDGFSWAGLGVFVCGLAFVALTLYIKNTRFPK